MSTTSHPISTGQLKTTDKSIIAVAVIAVGAMIIAFSFAPATHLLSLII